MLVSSLGVVTLFAFSPLGSASSCASSVSNRGFVVSSCGSSRGFSAFSCSVSGCGVSSRGFAVSNCGSSVPSRGAVLTCAPSWRGA
jgi:hypothetical protein